METSTWGKIVASEQPHEAPLLLPHCPWALLDGTFEGTRGLSLQFLVTCRSYEGNTPQLPH